MNKIQSSICTFKNITCSKKNSYPTTEVHMLEKSAFQYNLWYNCDRVKRDINI